MMGIQVLVKNPTLTPTTLLSACIRLQELFSLLAFPVFFDLPSFQASEPNC